MARSVPTISNREMVKPETSAFRADIQGDLARPLAFACRFPAGSAARRAIGSARPRPGVRPVFDLTFAGLRPAATMDQFTTEITEITEARRHQKPLARRQMPSFSIRTLKLSRYPKR
jgi:hypothetical protein